MRVEVSWLRGKSIESRDDTNLIKMPAYCGLEKLIIILRASDNVLWGSGFGLQIVEESASLHTRRCAERCPALVSWQWLGSQP